ncbi:MAG: sulfur carrier protein ThiS [Gammaproteobacteria bacterium]|nr:sulfur carrier protein ThiS [Gammaproteobacteria bacterium]
MQIELNGDRYRVDDGATVGALIERLSLKGRRVAVEVNEEVIPKSRHPEHRLREGDRVEIVHAIGGG